MTQEQEMELLKDQIQMLPQQLEQINKRIQKLAKPEK